MPGLQQLTDGVYYSGDLIGSHSGAVEAGSSNIGSSNFQIAMELGGNVITYLDLVGSRTDAEWTGELLLDSHLGGIMTEEALTQLLVSSITNSLPVPEEVEVVLEGVIGGLIPECGTPDTVMEDCDDLGGIAMGFSYSITPTVVIDPATVE